METTTKSATENKHQYYQILRHVSLELIKVTVCTCVTHKLGTLTHLKIARPEGSIWRKCYYNTQC